MFYNFVSKSYAISGGREVRVFVENDRVNEIKRYVFSELHEFTL